MKIEITLPGCPITKKNSQKIMKFGGHLKVVPSDQYKRYEAACGWQLPGNVKGAYIAYPVNVKCLYYMPTRRRVDLVNLLEATCDILVHFGVLADDCSKIVVGHDGSRVLYDKEAPRVEIEIERVTE